MSATPVRRLAGSVQFLTALTIRGETSSAADASLFFPLTGAALGGSAGVILHYGSLALGHSLGALLALAWLVWVSGGLHEDGLADVADAIRSGRSRERIFEILKDSCIGAYGASALILSLLLRWQAMANIQTPAIAGLAVALALSRASMVIVAGSTAAVGSGLAQSFAPGCGRLTMLAVAAQCALLLVGFGWYAGPARAIALAAVFVAGIAIARTWFVQTLGGVNGDCLGATCQAVEVAALLVLAWRPSF